MAEKNCSRCNTRHAYPWGKYCTYSPYSRYREELDELLGDSTDFKSTVKPEVGMSEWLNEAVRQSKLQSHDLIKGVESRLQASMEDKFANLEALIQRTHQEEAIKSSPPAPRISMARESGAGTHTYPPLEGHHTKIPGVTRSTSSEVTTGATGVTPGHHEGRKAGAPWLPSAPRETATTTTQLSEALKQLSLAIEPSTTERSEGIIFRPEWHSQHILKDISLKNMDHQKMSVSELLYGMICVLEGLLTTGNSDWITYLQHLKFIARQSISNVYLDSAFTGYDRMVVNKYLENRSAGFQAGDTISVSSNFHAANFRQNTWKEAPKNQPRRRQRSQRFKSDQEETVDIPDSWPDDVCFFYNRKRCYGRCNRSHICRNCRNPHKESECKIPEKKNYCGTVGMTHFLRVPFRKMCPNGNNRCIAIIITLTRTLYNCPMNGVNGVGTR